MVKMLLNLIKIHVLCDIDIWLNADHLEAELQVGGAETIYYICGEVKVTSNIAIMWPDFSCSNQGVQVAMVTIVWTKIIKPVVKELWL